MWTILIGALLVICGLLFMLREAPWRAAAQRAASVARYSAIWRKFPYRAESEIWVSADGLVLTMLRRYPGNGWQFPYGAVLDDFEHNADRGGAGANALRRCSLPRESEAAGRPS